MPGRGEVQISTVELGEIDTSGYWWNDRQGGVLGGILGSIGGIIGATVGIMTSMGKGRRFVLFLVIFTIGGGVILAGVGLTALVMGQPSTTDWGGVYRSVWYELPHSLFTISAVGVKTNVNARPRFTVILIESETTR